MLSHELSALIDWSVDRRRMRDKRFTDSGAEGSGCDKMKGNLRGTSGSRPSRRSFQQEKGMVGVSRFITIGTIDLCQLFCSSFWLYNMAEDLLFIHGVLTDIPAEPVTGPTTTPASWADIGDFEEFDEEDTAKMINETDDIGHYKCVE